MDLKDIEGAVHLMHEHGERFEGWYFSKKFIEKRGIHLKYKGIRFLYDFDIYEYNYRFVMPSRITFVGGLITYSVGERELGVFRFPRDEKNKFIAPLSLDKNKMKELLNLSKEDINKILSMKSPLVFEAFRIPQYGFELFEITEDVIESMPEFVDEEFIADVNKTQDLVIKVNTEKVREKIRCIPNYLLILRNVLNRQWKDFNEVACATDQIIHV